MVQYRQDAPGEPTAGSSQPRPVARRPPTFTKLVDKYLDLGDMRISNSSGLQTQTIEQEFQAYISKKAQRIKGLIRPYISQKAIKLLKCIIMIIWAYSGPHFNPKAI